jgi:hypothetical protein
MRRVSAPTLAFYYPGWIWRDPTWLKNLLLFFDGVALLVPTYLRNRLDAADPALVEGLRQNDLLHVLEPESLMNQQAAEALTEHLADLLASGALDDLVHVGGPMAELSLSRLGYDADRGLAEMLLEELEQRGLAGKSQDGLSVPLHWALRNVILVLLSQILRPQGAAIGLDLSPTTDQPQLHAALNDLLKLPSLPSAGRVVSLDLEAVGVDLSAVPLEEILEFRDEHGIEYRTYARDLRATLHDLSTLPSSEHASLLDDRREAFSDASRALNVRARAWWHKPASLALGLGGAAWTLKTGDPLGALVSATGAGLSAIPTPSTTVDAHSYLLQAHALGT